MNGSDFGNLLSNALAHTSRQVAREPLHWAGSIQPFGLLLGLSEPELILLQVSANAEAYLGIPVQNLLGQPLSCLVDAAALDVIQQGVQQGFSKLALRIWRDKQCWNATVSRATTTIVLELEPVSASPEACSLTMASRINQTIARLRQVPDLTDFLQAAASEVRHLTGFDRVMVYQFDAEGAGTVIAEAKRDNLLPYLGLHYPATDIPEPVRALYLQGLIRYIPDLSAQAVELIPAADPRTQQPLDLRFSVLRSVDPCCVEYHQNMDVAALLVTALRQGERLWGLISCHHQTPKSLPYEVRESCELLAQWIASELANKVNSEEISYLLKLRSLQSDFVQSIAQAQDLKQALVEPAPRLLDLVGAQGAAVCLADDMTLVGITPTPEQIRALLQWVDRQCLSSPAPLFQTHSLPKLYSEAERYQDRASGLLVLQISQVRRYAILWFRPEVLQTVNWAGDPQTALTVAADGGVTLCPRQSFERWQEVVQFTSLPWKACELENALDLRSAIVGIVLKQADELARVNYELENTIRELDSFAYAASHDLKEPLRGIHNYSSLLLKGYADVLDESGRSRLQTLIRLTRRMESLIDALLKFSRLGQTELNLQLTDLDQLLQQVLEELRISRPDLQTEIRTPHSLPTLTCDPILMHEVLSNLISNALKYNDKPEPWIEIGLMAGAKELNWAQSESTQPATDFVARSAIAPPACFYVRDNGIGIRERHLDRVFRLFKRLHEQHLYGGGTGAGLTIAKKIIERHGGQVWVESTYGQGSTFYFTLP